MSEEQREDNGVLKGHYPCHHCGGSDPLAVYDKGEEYDGYCFSCNVYVNNTEVVDHVDLENPVKTSAPHSGQQMTEEELESIKALGFCGWRDRRITTATSKRYGVYTKVDSVGTVKYRYYPSHKDNEIVGFHVRNDFVKQARKVDKTVKGAPFFAIGTVSNKCQLFGQTLFPRGGKYLVITGGEEDAQAVYQVLQKGDYETPVVSPTVGEGNARQQIQANFEYVNSFQKVVLMFDNDKAGRDAAKDITKMFGFGKVVIADLTFKDPCEYLKQPNGTQQLRKAFWEAMPKKPSQVLSVADIYEKAMQVPEMGLSFPWPSATKATLGIRRGEIHIVGAAPKIG